MRSGASLLTTGEPTANTSLAEVLQSLRRNWKVEGEPVGALQGGKRPDVLITEPGRAPTIVETEFVPAATVDSDSLAKIKSITKDGRQIAAVVAVRLPARLKKVRGEKLRKELRAASDLEYAAYQPGRFPKTGYVKGGVTDIAQIAQTVSLPAEVIGEWVKKMRAAIERIAGLLAGSGKDTREKTAKLLSLGENEQTWNMAGLILSNAFVFHSHIAGERGIKTLQELLVLNTVPAVSIVAEWGKILEINYYAIFDVARSIITYVKDEDAQEIVSVLLDTTGKINARGLATSTDMYGTLIQGMIKDRETLASFYTLPESAALLAGLAVPPPGAGVYSSPESMKEFKFGDFACGTGALLTSAYKMLIANYEAAGNDMREIHDDMMGGSIFGFDVLPSAVHLTVSSLAEVFPKKLFTETKVGKLLYGRRGSDLHLGSLDLISKQSTLGGGGDYVTGTASDTFFSPSVPDGYFSLVLMNPPFTRNAKADTDRHEMFASFDTDRDDQRKMAAIGKRLFKDTCAHGNAGAGSNFVAIADRKLKPGGVLGLVLPSTIAWGESWKACRDLLKDGYGDLTVVSIAAADRPTMSFSFDTGMGEVLVVARKRERPADGPPRGRFASLHRRPESVLDSIGLCKDILGSKPNRLDGDNHGGTPLKAGKDVHGSVLDCPLDGEWWWPVAVRDHSLIQFAYRMARGRFVLPGALDGCGIHVTKAGASFGIPDRDIADNKDGDKRAPFLSQPFDETAVYRVLARNNSREQTRMVFEPNGMAVPKAHAKKEDVARVAATATRLHVNRTCDYTSQQILFPYTAKPTLASRVFTSFEVPREHEKAMAVWGNSTPGIICFWAHAGKQQLGRGNATRRSMEHMTVLDTAKLKKPALKKLDKIFDKYSKREFCRMNLCYKDENRIGMDTEMLSVLGIDDPIDDLRVRFCREPLVRKGREDTKLDAL